MGPHQRKNKRREKEKATSKNKKDVSDMMTHALSISNISCYFIGKDDKEDRIMNQRYTTFTTAQTISAIRLQQR